MSKAKLYLVLAVALVASLAFAAPAFAWTHGQFSATTDACGGCHVAHAAQLPKLLKAGATQTHFCFLCHGDGATSAPYDVKDGITSPDKNTWRPSTAGGFVRQWVDTNGNGLPEPGELVSVTSRHNVWGLEGESGAPDASDPRGDYFIPGSTNRFTGTGFVCGSCHDPHDGGKTPDSNGIVQGNPRLLRKTLFGETVDYVAFKMETVGTFTYQGVSSGVYVVTDYVYGSTGWCGACHNKFRDTVIDGHASQVYGLYRHPTVAHIITQPKDASIAKGTPIEKWTLIGKTMDRVACLSCHRAHSTTATMTGWATSYPRSESDPEQRPPTSALLRMNNRGICWNCHDAAKYNCWADTSMNCSQCHH